MRYLLAFLALSFLLGRAVSAPVENQLTASQMLREVFNLNVTRSVNIKLVKLEEKRRFSMNYKQCQTLSYNSDVLEQYFGIYSQRTEFSEYLNDMSVHLQESSVIFKQQRQLSHPRSRQDSDLTVFYNYLFNLEHTYSLYRLDQFVQQKNQTVTLHYENLIRYATNLDQFRSQYLNYLVIALSNEKLLNMISELVDTGNQVEEINQTKVMILPGNRSLILVVDSSRKKNALISFVNQAELQSSQGRAAILQQLADNVFRAADTIENRQGELTLVEEDFLKEYKRLVYAPVIESVVKLVRQEIPALKSKAGKDVLDHLLVAENAKFLGFWLLICKQIELSLLYESFQSRAGSSEMLQSLSAQIREHFLHSAASLSDLFGSYKIQGATESSLAALLEQYTFTLISLVVFFVFGGLHVFRSNEWKLLKQKQK